jgi:hypothetical protein
LEEEAQLRRLFVNDRSNPLLLDPHVGLVNIFGGPPDIRITRARVIRSEQELDAKYVLPLSARLRRAGGSPATVKSLDVFLAKFHAFTGGSLRSINWDNIVVAGGSVLACLTPHAAQDDLSQNPFCLPEYRSSDVDLFLFGLTPNQVCDFMLASIPTDHGFSGGAKDDRGFQSHSCFSRLSCHMRPDQACCHDSR